MVELVDTSDLSSDAHCGRVGSSPTSGRNTRLKPPRGVFVASIGGGEKQLMTVGQTSLDFIKDDLEKSAEMNSFCARGY